jgi:hypothetical protein
MRLDTSHPQPTDKVMEFVGVQGASGEDMEAATDDEE